MVFFHSDCQMQSYYQCRVNKYEWPALQTPTHRLSLSATQDLSLRTLIPSNSSISGAKYSRIRKPNTLVAVGTVFLCNQTEICMFGEWVESKAKTPHLTMSSGCSNCSIYSSPLCRTVLSEARVDLDIGWGRAIQSTRDMHNIQKKQIQSKTNVQKFANGIWTQWIWFYSLSCMIFCTVSHKSIGNDRQTLYTYRHLCKRTFVSSSKYSFFDCHRTALIGCKKKNNIVELLA